MKTKNKVVDAMRRLAAVETGMKAPGFNLSTPLVGILSLPQSSVFRSTEKAINNKRFGDEVDCCRLRVLRLPSSSTDRTKTQAYSPEEEARQGRTNCTAYYPVSFLSDDDDDG